MSKLSRTVQFLNYEFAHETFYQPNTKLQLIRSTLITDKLVEGLEVLA